MAYMYSKPGAIISTSSPDVFNLCHTSTLLNFVPTIPPRHHAFGTAMSVLLCAAIRTLQELQGFTQQWTTTLTQKSVKSTTLLRTFAQ